MAWVAGRRGSTCMLMKLKLKGPGKKRAPNTFNFISNIILKNFKKIKEIENKKKKMFFYLFFDCTRFFYSLRAI